MATNAEPFATLEDLKKRWPDFPSGADGYAETHLEDATQYILDVAPHCMEVSESTRRRIVCAVVRRAMAADADGSAGIAETQSTMGPFSASYTVANPHGDYYLTKQEMKALGGGNRPRAFGFQAGILGSAVSHRPWCDLYFLAKTCSCGASLTLDGPLWEA